MELGKGVRYEEGRRGIERERERKGNGREGKGREGGGETVE